MNEATSSETDSPPIPRADLRLVVLETLVIICLFVIMGGGTTPDVNEAHYLAKAKHYWNPAWLAGDIFLESHDAHVVFYWTFGWLTLLFPLPVVAWIGRFITWTLLAWSWRRLSWQLVPRPFCSILTAALLVVGVQYAHLAGEWIIGGVEAKGLAYVCVFMGLAALAKAQWNRTWLWLGGATAFHVLVGGWSIVAVGFAWLLLRGDRPPLKSMLPALVLSYGLSLIGLAPALLLSRGVDAETAATANRIYVEYRLPHHLVFHRLDHWFMVRHGLLLLGVAVGGWWWLRQREAAGGHRRVMAFVGGCVLIGVCGVLIDQVLLYNRSLANSLLRFYWLRLSDVMLPAAAALLAVMIARRAADRRPAAGQLGIVLLMAIAALGVGAKYFERRADDRPRADAQQLPRIAGDPERTKQIYHDWRQMTAWAKANTPTDAVFLTPRMQQTFKWYANRKEVVSWKDVPQDAAGIVQWWTRYREVHAYSLLDGGLSRRSDHQLRELAAKYDADYVVIDRTYARRPIGLQKVYPHWPDSNMTYEVYRLEQ